MKLDNRSRDPIRVGFVGTGKMAHLHLHSLRRVPTPHVVVGVHDTDEGARRQFAGLADATGYRTLRELLEAGRPDLVHICTPAGTHFEPARAALLAGAHVYVEKPFVETHREAEELLGLADARGLLVCAGHQQLRDPAYLALLRRAPELGNIVQVESYFTFRPVGANPERAGARALATQLVDVLPHPLYTLVDALERLAPAPGPIEIASLVTSPTDLHAVLRANDCYGRLSLSLRARPVASLLSASGRGGTLTADFLRTSVVGAANPGESPVEKAGNPLVEAWQLAVRSMRGVAGRIFQGGDYPGLAELIGAFYAAVASGGASPLAPDHLKRVTALFEELSANVRGAVERVAVQPLRPRSPALDAPLAVVTGARGFFGREITTHLVRRGYRVRGISRSPNDDDPHVHEWLRLDLSRSAPPEAFAGADVVVHAAAEAAGGFESHQRNTIDVARNVLRGMHGAGVTRLVYVSSLSVLRPPRTPWEQQDERTPLARADDRRYGAYVWGKTAAERLVMAEAPSLGIELRIIRPGALVDWGNPDVPGIVGRRLFGRWHLGFGRPGLPVPVCEVSQAAAVVAWLAAQFEEAPSLLNLIDPAISTRRNLLEEFAKHGWRGRMLWVPIPLFAMLVHAARYALALPTLRRPTPLALYAILRPRRYSVDLAAPILHRAVQEPARNALRLAASPA
jgi:predicted dehydrogenase/nucleoside-diphosphate-sugar epimerase